MSNLRKYYDRNYLKHGIKFQRQYPNEELIRFISRNFSGLNKIKKKKKLKF